MINKQKIGAILFFILGVLFIPLFFLGANTVLDVLEKKSDMIFLSQGIVFTTATPLLSYFFISVAIKSLILQRKNERIKDTNKYIWIFKSLFFIFLLSFPVTWYLISELTANNYEKCPEKNMFIQKYTTDLSLCSDPYYEERAGVKR
ncbi:DUF1240 domain-containing protein [Morganella morganii]|nr:DUF1240 domain-containing protein [Morganella morganii]